AKNSFGLLGKSSGVIGAPRVLRARPGAPGRALACDVTEKGKLDAEAYPKLNVGLKPRALALWLRARDTLKACLPGRPARRSAVLPRRSRSCWRRADVVPLPVHRS